MSSALERVEQIREKLVTYAASHPNVSSVSTERTTYWADDDAAAPASVAVCIAGFGSDPALVVEAEDFNFGNGRLPHVWLRMGATEVWIVEADGTIWSHTRGSEPTRCQGRTPLLPGFQA